MQKENKRAKNKSAKVTIQRITTGESKLGQASVPGLHTFRIADDGLQAFLRTLGLSCRKTTSAPRRRLSSGIAELDKMMNGGLVEGDSLLIAGPSGTGKSALATQFIAEGLRQGDAAVIRGD